MSFKNKRCVNIFVYFSHLVKASLESVFGFAPLSSIYLFFDLADTFLRLTYFETSNALKVFVFLTVAVVICFFLCWAPQHAQRLAYTWAMKYTNDPLIAKIFIFTTYVSGILYYVSTCINPLVYNIMSNKFRQAFKVILMWSIYIPIPPTIPSSQNVIKFWFREHLLLYVPFILIYGDVSYHANTYQRRNIFILMKLA